MNDYDGELHALRDVVSVLCSWMRDEVAGDEGKLADLDRVMERWHRWRSERFEREVEDAELTLEKAAQIGDYGFVGGSDKFVPQDVARSLERHIKELKERK